ncbi:MAG TPA: hypothetical protein P5137_12145 [Candidatus Brocadiia bacterium]|nr:hypothetical protein [Candidatus Brocadiia bacterium]
MSKSAGKAIAILAAVLVAATAWAAFQEVEILNQVNDSIAVLRYLHREVKALEEKREMVRNSLALTRKQFDAQRQIVEEETQRKEDIARRNLPAAEKEEQTRVADIRIEIFKLDMEKLRRHLKTLEDTNLDKLYAERLAALRKTIERYKIQNEAKLLEFRVHFGKEPQVSLDFEAKTSRFLQKRLGLTYLTLR